MQSAYTVLTLLMLVGVSQIGSRFIPWLPIPLLQISLGAIVGWPALGLHISLNPELFMFLFLPPLLFADGWHVPKRDLWKYKSPIFLLAVGLVVFTVFGAGYFIHFLIPAIPLAAAFALAAILSPTDAVAVAAVAKGKLPKSMMVILQGESLMNDATGLVTFKVALTAAILGQFSFAQASVSFVVVALGGLIVGVVLSWLLGQLRGWMIQRGWDDPATHVMFMLLLPFTAYLAAEHFHLSGILSAVAAGIMQSWVDLLPKQTSTRLLNKSVWLLLEYVFNGLIFLLLGLQLPDILKDVISRGGAARGVSSFVWQLFVIFLIFFVLIVLRYIWVQVNWFLINRLRRISKRGPAELPRTKRTSLILTIAGVRGAVTLAGVLSVPLLIDEKLGTVFPERGTMIFIAMGVIILSLITACVLLPILLRGIDMSSDGSRQREFDEAWRKTSEAAVHALESEELTTDPSITQDATLATMAAEARARVMAEYREHLESYADSDDTRLRAEQLDKLEKMLRIRALRAQRLELYRLRRRREIGDDTVRRALDELDLLEATLGGTASSH